MLLQVVIETDPGPYGREVHCLPLGNLSLPLKPFNLSNYAKVVHHAIFSKEYYNSISAVYIQYIAALLLYGNYNTPLAFIPHAKYYLAS